MKRVFSFLTALLILAALCARSAAARSGAYEGVALCTELLIPSLLPFFAASGLVNRLGLTEYAERLLAPAAARLLHIRGRGLRALLLGLLGGYPLGAAAVGELYRDGSISREQAAQLLCFCNNTGPAFAVAAIGSGAFGRAEIGFFLYLIHAVTAVLLGMLFRPKKVPAAPARSGALSPAPSFSQAAAASAAASLRSMAGVCTNVIFFSALLGVAKETGVLRFVSRLLSAYAGLDAEYADILTLAFFELSSAAGALRAVGASRLSLSAAAFMLGWGGLCVHMQSAAAAGDIPIQRSLFAKLLHGVLSAGAVYFLAPFFL